MHTIPKEKLPRHIACIMDGNGRWAHSRGLPRRAGHRAGADTVERCVDFCISHGIPWLTLYAFSSENWNRPKTEVRALMLLLHDFLKKRLREINLVLALSYGSRAEIAGAARKIAQKISAGELRPDAITEETFGQYLDTAGMPDPDLLIRTSGEMRISNFLLWQISYAELYLTDTLWPDFSEQDMEAAVKDYARRTRRFGGI